MMSDKAIEKSKANGFTVTQHFEAVSRIGELYRKAEAGKPRPDKNGSPDILSIRRFSAPFTLSDGTKANVRITVKETAQHGNKIYSLELRK